MSMETVSKTRNRVYLRKFDHDKAKALHLEGVPITAIARAAGVSQEAVRRVVDDKVRERMYRKSTEAIMSGTCADCGKYGIVRTALRCRPCSDARVIREAPSVRPDGTLRCSDCGEWKQPEDYKMGHHGKVRRVARGGRYHICRPCDNKRRTAFRLRQRVPCKRCGKLRTGPSDVRKGRQDSGLCKDCYLDSVRQS